MSAEILRREHQEFKKWSRRVSFLLLITISLLALPDTNGNTELSRRLVQTFTSLSQLIHQSQADEFVQQMQSLTSERTNPRYSDRLDIIKTALVAYDQSHPDELAFWKQETKYASDQEALVVLLRSNHARGIVDATHREELIQVLMEELPVSMRLSYELRPVMEGTSLYRNSASDAQIAAYYETIKSELETTIVPRSWSGRISESMMLHYFLERTHGDIAEALADMAAFLKYMIRGVGPTYDPSQSTWVLSNVEDQLDPDFSFNDIPNWSTLSAVQQQDIINYLGLIYHTYGIIGPLDSLSPAVIAAGVSANYSIEQTSITAYKMRVDYQTVERLNAILAMLTRNYAKIAS